jgi:hypothetical protein
MQMLQFDYHHPDSGYLGGFIIIYLPNAVLSYSIPLLIT